MKKKLAVLFLGSMVFRFVLAPLIWHPDVNNHVDWGIKFFEYGARNFYSPEANIWAYTWPNQPPGTILIFALIRKLYELVFAVFWFINTNIPAFPSGIITFLDERFYQVMLKAPSILTDLGIAYLIYVLVSELKNKKAGFLGAFIFLINPIVWYNSAVWGQTDAIINFLMLFAFFLLTKKRLVWASIALASCLFIKLSLVIFVPILVLFAIKEKYGTTQKALAIAIPVILILILTLPFSNGNEPISWLISLYREKVLTNQMQVVTANAFNFWGALTGVYEISHELLLGPLTYKQWGYVLFVVSIVPSLFLLWKKPDTKTALWSFVLIAFSSWMLLTNMHERYLYPMFPYLAILAVLETRLLPLYLGISTVNFINLYHLWWTPRWFFAENLLTVYNRLVPRVLSLVMTMFYLLFYKRFLKR